MIRIIQGKIFVLIFLIFSILFLIPNNNYCGEKIWGTVIYEDGTNFIVEGKNGYFYKCEWYGGSILFFEGDTVLLTKSWGFGYMIKRNGKTKMRVWIDEYFDLDDLLSEIN